MGTRRHAREAALQILYLCDICNFPMEDAQAFFGTLELKDVSREFARQLFSGVYNKKTDLDGMITKYAENWALDRMATIDRNILRLALFEIIDTPQTPINVIIDEAVEIAKCYSTAESGKFVNGILDKMKCIRNTGDKP